MLGERTFSFDGHKIDEAAEAISSVIRQFYLFHAPKEIRVSIELSDKKEIEAELKSRVGRRVPIVLLNEKNRKISTELAVYRSSAELDVQRSRIEIGSPALLRELQRSLNLPLRPARIVAIDAAHISGTDQVAASVSWNNGRIDPSAARSWASDAGSELGTLEGFVRRLRDEFSGEENLLLLIDGGPAQLNAVRSIELSKNVALVAAVKPPQDHGSISHFLTASGDRVDFDIALPSHRLMHQLRDEAHAFANAVHRDTRDYANYYRMVELLPSLTETERRALLVSIGSIAAVEKSSDADIGKVLGDDRVLLAKADIARYRSGQSLKVRPLVVPTRLQAENGAAEDLRPIETVSFGKKRPR